MQRRGPQFVNATFCGFGPSVCPPLSPLSLSVCPLCPPPREQCTVDTGTELSRAEFSYSRVSTACHAGTPSVWSSSGRCISAAMAVECTSTSSIVLPLYSIQSEILIRRRLSVVLLVCCLSPVVCRLSAPVPLCRPVSYTIACNQATQACLLTYAFDSTMM